MSKREDIKQVRKSYEGQKSRRKVVEKERVHCRTMAAGDLSSLNDKVPSLAMFFPETLNLNKTKRGDWVNLSREVKKGLRRGRQGEGDGKRAAPIHYV